MNIRPATREDAEFLKTMLFEAARWNPDWPFEPMETVLAEPMLVRYHEDWGRPGDGGAVAELDGVPVQPLHRRKGIGEALLRAAKVQAREEGYQALSLSVAAHNRSRMMYERSGFEKVAEDGDSWTMVANL